MVDEQTGVNQSNSNRDYQQLTGSFIVSEWRQSARNPARI